MATFTLTNRRGNETIPPTDNNEFEISSLQATKCPGLTTLLVSSFPGLDPSTHFADFNINKGDFITLGPGSVVINTSCK